MKQTIKDTLSVLFYGAATAMWYWVAIDASPVLLPIALVALVMTFIATLGQFSLVVVRRDADKRRELAKGSK